MHKPSGLGIYGLWQHEEVDGVVPVAPFEDDRDAKVSTDTEVWYVKPFWRKTWGAMNGVGLGRLAPPCSMASMANITTSSLV